MSKQIAILLDPDKTPIAELQPLALKINDAKPDYILIGGSSVNGSIDDFVLHLKHLTDIPLYLFPGDITQFTPHADGILYLSLISGRNPDFLIGKQVTSALAIKHSDLQIIPTGYILIDGGIVSATQQVSNTTPLSRDDISQIVSTAAAAELLGMKAVYLEAGSGAKIPVSSEVISAVRSEISTKLIVGGGISTTEQLRVALDAGADIVVVGNHFEKRPDEIGDFCRFVHNYNK